MLEISRVIYYEMSQVPNNTSGNRKLLEDAIKMGLGPKADIDPAEEVVKSIQDNGDLATTDLMVVWYLQQKIELKALSH